MPKKILHKSAADRPLDKSPAVDDSPWPEGHWPLVVRGQDPLGEWLHGAEVEMEPAAGVFYDTREKVPAGPWRLYRWDVQFRALVPPGEYQVTFTHPDHVATYMINVPDPFDAVAEVMFRDEMPFKMRPDSWDTFIVNEQPYGRLLQLAEPSFKVMDAGAHIGTFTRDALRKGVSEVIAYEPEPMNATLLRENTANLGLPVTVVQGALVGNDETSVQLLVDGVDQGRNALHSIVRSRGGRLPVRVPAYNFTDEVWKNRPNLLKVDVEDAEYTYSWEMPPEVVGVAVEFGSPKTRAEDTSRITSEMEAQGFTTLRSPGTVGWATMGIWSRE